MYKIPLAEIKAKILGSGKLAAEELEKRIKEKINDLSGLISEEGAAHIIANELNVELFNLDNGRLKVKEIFSGMRSVYTSGKVLRKFEVREFTKNKHIGKVCSLMIGDETGTIRVVFWNDQVDLLKEVKEGDLVVVKDAYGKDNNGSKEIHLGEKGSLEINPPGLAIESVREDSSKISFYRRKMIQQLQPDENNVEVLGTIVQVFDPRFFLVCPQCGRRINGNSCSLHGLVQPALSYVLNVVLDDGSGTIRAVFWREQTNHLLDKTTEEIIKYNEKAASFENQKTELLGEQFKVKGRVQKNEMFDRLEFNVQMVEKASPQEEITRLETAETDFLD